jgi:hypothetical protein
MARLQALSLKVYMATVGTSYLGDDADKGGFTGAVRPQQTEDTPYRDLKAHVIEGRVVGVGFTYAVNFKNAQSRNPLILTKNTFIKDIQQQHINMSIYKIGKPILQPD